VSAILYYCPNRAGHNVEPLRRGLALMRTKIIFGAVSVLLVVITAYVTWKIAEYHYAEQFAAIDDTIRNLQLQTAQLNKEGGPQLPQVYGSSRLQLQDIHVVFEPPRKPNIFGNVINKGALVAREPSSGASYLVAPRDLTAQEIDGLAAQAIGSVQAGDRNIQFQPDQIHGFSIDFDMTQEQFDKFRNQRQKFYLVYVVAYRDETLPAGKIRMTEACYIYDGDLSQGQLCSEHNRAFIADSPPIK
jgi:hypothetical protein